MAIFIEKTNQPFISIAVSIFLILSLFPLFSFDSPFIEHVSGDSSWVQTTETDFKNGILENLTVSSKGNISLSLASNYIEDSYINDSKIQHKNNIEVDTITGEIKLLKINKTFHYGDYDYGKKVLNSTDGGYIILGEKWINSDYDLWLIKTDKNGNEKWNRTFRTSNHDWADRIIKTNDDGYLILSTIDPAGGNYDIWLIKTNATGIKQWEKKFTGFQHDLGGSLIKTADGGYAIIGYTGITLNDYDVLLIKVNSTGSEQWRNVYGAAENDEGNSIQQTSDGGYIITGETRSYGAGSADVWLVKTNVTGSVLWDRTFGGTSWDEGHSVQNTNDNGYVMTGYTHSFGMGDSDLWIIKTNETGIEDWNYTFGGSNRDIGNAIQQTLDNGYIIAGSTASFGTGTGSAWLIKTDNSGNEIWNKTYGGLSWDKCNDVKQTSDGGYVVTGNSKQDTTGVDILLFKTNETGCLLFKNGNFTSSNLLIGNNATLIDNFSYNLSLPSQTEAKIQFSINNTFWFNATGDYDQWDLLSNGINNIELTSLNLNGSRFYYRINFTSLENNIPVLYNINLSYFQFNTFGIYESQYFDTGKNVNWNNISWIAVKPSNTDIKFQIRTASTQSGLISKSFIGPDGTNGSYYISTSSNIWSGHDADRWIQYKAYLITYNGTKTPFLNQVSISFNKKPDAPTLISPANNAIIGNSKPVFTWSFTDADSNSQSAYQWQVDDTDTFSSINYDSGIITSSLASYSHPLSISDGTWYWRIRTKDSDGDWGGYSNSKILIIDTTINSPLNLITNPTGWTSTNSFNVSWTNPTDISGIMGAYYKPNTAPTSNTDGIYISEVNINSIPGISVSEDGEIQIYVWLEDNAGNVDYFNRSTTILNLDTTPPDTPIGLSSTPGLWTSINSYNISWTNPTDLTYIEGAYYKLDNLPLSNNDGIYIPGDNITSINGITVSDNGEHQIYVWLKDKVKNVDYNNNATTKLFFDGTAPQAPIGITVSPNDWTNENSFLIDWTNPSELSGIKTGAYYYIGNDPPIKQTDGTWISNKPFKITDIPEGQNDIYIWLEDSVGNSDHLNYGLAELKFDPESPENLFISINNNSKFTNLKDVNINYTGQDSISGINEMLISFDELNWMHLNVNKTSEVIELPVGDGNKIVFLSAKDKAGNIAQTNDSIILDTLPPYSLSISINNDALQTNSTTVTLTLEAKDNTSGVDRISFSADGKVWSEWEEYSNSRTYKLSTGDGKKTVFYKTIDKAGNIADPISTSIILNTSIPPQPKIDTDDDGHPDDIDAFPADPSQWLDSDGDGYGDNQSGNNSDTFPNDKTEWVDSDLDGVGDNRDEYPNDPNKWEYENPVINETSKDPEQENYTNVIIGIAIVIILIILLAIVIKSRIGKTDHIEEEYLE